MKKTEKHALTVRIALLVMLDILFMQVASFASLWIRHEFDFQAVEETFIHTVWRYMPLNILVTLAVFSMFHLYTSLWKYASITELSCIVAAVAISSLLHVLGMAVMGLKMFKSYLLLYFLLFLFMVVGLRFSYRFFRFVRNKCNRGMAEKRENVMIIGAGDAGAAIIKENRLSKAATRKVCCLIDKDPKKWGRYILGCPVVGGADKIMESVEKYKIQKIVIAIPSATSQQIKELVEICKETKCELKILPGIYQLIDGEVSISQLREVEIEDLLGREPVKVDLEEILGYIQGKKNYRNSQAAKMIQILGISVCPYCNQNYINVVYDKKGKVRFWGDLDHFYDKSTYPELAVCLYNMIPVCKTCNQLKSSQKKSIVNPYNSQRKSRIKFGTDFDNKFDLDYLQGKSKNFNIVINKKVLTLEDKEEIEVFDLDNRYQQLKQNVQEIIIKSKAYDERYQKNLKEQFQFNDEELESYIFGYTENHLNRALSKFNLDIMNEFRNKGNCKEVGRSISKMKE